MSQHKQFENNIPKFFKNELKDNDLRRFVYHYEECESCRDQANEEYAFFATYNDMDKESNYDHRKDLKTKVSYTIAKIEFNDKILRIKYTILSIVICVLGMLFVGFVLRFIYR